MIFNRNDVTTVNSRLDLQGATSAEARIEMAAGGLALRGGASGLMEATFICNEKLAPDIRHDVTNGRASLLVRQPELPRSIGSFRNEWDIALNGDIPIELRIDQSTGTTTLDASDLRLARLALRSTTGRTDVRIDGAQPELGDVDIETTTGATEISLRGAFDTLQVLRVGATTGAVDLDLRGTFRADVEARVTAATGAVTVMLPHDIGVEVEARASLGKVSARGLTREGSVYRNQLFSSAPVTLRLSVSTSVGRISLKAGD
jgi:hypothetical protein